MVVTMILLLLFVFVVLVVDHDEKERIIHTHRQSQAFWQSYMARTAWLRSSRVEALKHSSGSDKLARLLCSRLWRSPRLLRCIGWSCFLSSTQGFRA